MTSTLRLSLLSLLAAAVVGIAGPAAAGCLSASQAQKAVASGAVMRLATIARAVGGEVVDAKLCDGGGIMVYRLVVMRDGGQVETVVVDATSGQRLR